MTEKRRDIRFGWVICRASAARCENEGNEALCWPELEICGGNEDIKTRGFLLARELKRLRREKY